MTTDERLLTSAEAAELAGVGVGTIRKARFDGRLKPACVEPRGNVNEYFYSAADILTLWPKREPRTDDV